MVLVSRAGVRTIHARLRQAPIETYAHGARQYELERADRVPRQAMARPHLQQGAHSCRRFRRETPPRCCPTSSLRNPAAGNGPLAQGVRDASYMSLCGGAPPHSTVDASFFLQERPSLSSPRVLCPRLTRSLCASHRYAECNSDCAGSMRAHFWCEMLRDPRTQSSALWAAVYCGGKEVVLSRLPPIQPSNLPRSV